MTDDNYSTLPVVASRWAWKKCREDDGWAYRSEAMKPNTNSIVEQLCRLTDAQAKLAEKDARIAQLAAHARGKNKALANALKEIERLKRTIETGLDNELALVGERTELRAQLEQLQAAPAERGVVTKPSTDQCLDGFVKAVLMWWHRRVAASNCNTDSLLSAIKAEVGSVPEWAKDHWALNEKPGGYGRGIGVSYGDIAELVYMGMIASLNPAPATADSDVREVKK